MKTEHIQIRVSPELKGLIKIEARKRGMSMSEFIVKALRKFKERDDV